MAIGVGLDEVAVTAAGLKGTLGCGSIWKGENATAVHFIVVEWALVTLTGLPGHYASALHAVVLPVAFISPGLMPVVLAEAVDLVALELAVIRAAV